MTEREDCDRARLEASRSLNCPLSKVDSNPDCCDAIDTRTWIVNHEDAEFLSKTLVYQAKRMPDYVVQTAKNCQELSV